MDLNKKLLDNIGLYINENKIEECLLFLIEELSCALHPDANSILTAIIRINTLFPVYNSHYIYRLYIKNKKKITNHEFINTLIWLTPIKVEDVAYNLDYKGHSSISSTVTDEMREHPGGYLIGFNLPAIEEGEGQPAVAEGLSYSDIDATVIQFTLPYTFTSQNIGPLIEKGFVFDKFGVDFYFKKVSNYTNHPFFIEKLHQQVVNSGNTIAHNLDIYPGQGDVTFVQIVTKGMSSTEFDLKIEDDSLVVSIPDLVEDRALFGKDYLPPKLKSIKLLKKFLKDNKISIDQNNAQLTIDSFSFLKVIFVRYEKMIAIHEKCFFMTSSSLFKKHSEWYIGRIQKIGYLETGFQNRFNSIVIDTGEDLKEFIKFLIDEVIVNSINYKSGYKYLWLDDDCETSPKIESRVQPYLFNLIEFLCELKGVSAVREPATAEGAVDMLFMYTSQDSGIFKVCLELKRAQHQYISTAINSQLKTYLISQKTRLGIYLVLWFKYNDKNKFNSPAKYNTIDDLRIAIEKNNPSDCSVDTLIIDCTKPISPSKLH